MAHLSGLEVEAVKADLEGVARDVAKRFNAVILLKGQESLLAEPSGEIFVHRGGTVGLATGGSGDVLAGIIGGLAAQGASTDRKSTRMKSSHSCAARMASSAFKNTTNQTTSHIK